MLASLSFLFFSISKFVRTRVEIDKIKKQTEFYLKAKNCYDAATNASNWQYKWALVNSKNDVERWQKTEDSLKNKAKLYIDSAKKINP